MTQNFLVTNIQVGNREDLADFIRDVNYKKTPLLSMAGKATAKAILHEWVEDTLQDGVVSTNTKAEGFAAAYSASDNDIRVRRTNNCEIISRSISVSRTQNKVDKAGLGQGSEYDHQLERKTKSLALDINKTLWQQTATTRDADAGTAGKMNGYFAIATVHTRALVTPVTLSDDLYNSLLQEMVEDCVDPDTVFAAGFNKRAISSWATPNRRYANDEKTIVDMVQEYEGDWGVQKIVYDKHVPASSLAVTQMDQLKVAYLDPFEHVKKDQTKSAIDGEQGYVLSEVTLQYGAKKAHGSITNLAVS